MKKSICSIHQPNLFPWLGYFTKIAKADKFIFLDEVHPPQSSRGSWTNRVKLVKGVDSVGWLSCPISKQTKYGPINKMEMIDAQKWKQKTLNTLNHSYKRSQYFTEVMTRLEKLILNDNQNLSQYNIHFITEITTLLGLSTSFAKQSTISNKKMDSLRGSKKLALICRHVGAGFYLSGDGASGYEDTSAYSDYNIQIIKNNFTHPVYPQVNTSIFSPGLSIIDILFNIGFDEVKNLLSCQNKN